MKTSYLITRKSILSYWFIILLLVALCFVASTSAYECDGEEYKDLCDLVTGPAKGIKSGSTGSGNGKEIDPQSSKIKIAEDGTLQLEDKFGTTMEIVGTRDPVEILWTDQLEESNTLGVDSRDWRVREGISSLWLVINDSTACVF